MHAKKTKTGSKGRKCAPAQIKTRGRMAKKKPPINQTRGHVFVITIFSSNAAARAAPVAPRPQKRCSNAEASARFAL